MKHSPPTLNNIEYNKTEEFQRCAGKNCNKQGTNYLKIIYIDKTGWFCDLCKLNLIRLELVVLENESLKIDKPEENVY